MEDQTKENLTNESIWGRLVYMVVLAIGYEMIVLLEASGRFSPYNVLRVILFSVRA